MLFHSQSAEEVLAHLGSSKSGLNNAQVEQARVKHGLNELPDTQVISWFKLLIRQFKSFLVLVLVAAAIISWVTAHIIDMYVILAVVVINAMIGFIQEMRAERASQALKKMIVAKARVIRNGESAIVAVKELVPGDILIVEEGDSIAADARLLESRNLRTIEASLTGESVPVSKSVEVLPKETPLADRKNILLKGTFVAGGYAQAVVCGTGVNTAIGAIAITLSAIREEKSNFQKKTDRLARQMGLLSLASAILLFAVGYFKGTYDTHELLMVSIAALVSAIPEGLPAVLSIVLAIGSSRMAKRNAIIRQMNSVETLGAVTTIITDKTGTLTQNTLTVRKVFLPGEPELRVSGEGWFPVGNFVQNEVILDCENNPQLQQLLKIAAWSNNSEIKHNTEKNTYELHGDPTEGALLVMSKKSGMQKRQDLGIEKVSDLPFSSKMKMRATLISAENEYQLLVVGAPEKVLATCTHIQTKNGVALLDDAQNMQIQSVIDNWSVQAMRVIGLAWKPMPQGQNEIEEHDLSNLIFAGVVGMIDPPRTDVLEAVQSCHSAGIRVVMATGDHINTAIAIARATGIINNLNTKEPIALTEQQLLKLDDIEFDEVIKTVNVFARLTPNMKLRIAERLQQLGELVAMTGDGVNDAPALKKADVGVAMGIMGTDVARDASNVVLADDNFSTIVSAVEEGRIVFTNARQTSFFLVTTNFAEITILVSLVALGYPIALTATQILWLNLVTDGLGDIALATEQGHGDSLSQKPVKRDENILNKEIWPFLAIMGVVMTALSLATYFYFLPQGIEKARTTVFIVMAFSQLFNLFNMRSLKKSVFLIGLFSNKFINLAIIASLVIQVAIIEIPFFQNIFSFDPVNAVEFAILISISSFILWAGEAYKWFMQRTLINQ